MDTSNAYQNLVAVLVRLVESKDTSVSLQLLPVELEHGLDTLLEPLSWRMCQSIESFSDLQHELFAMLCSEDC